MAGQAFVEVTKAHARPEFEADTLERGSGVPTSANPNE